jgi:hypothetical protein
MKNKYYNVTLALDREAGQFGHRIEIFTQQHIAISHEDAVAKAIKTEQAINLLIDGYAVRSKSATELHETVAPFNSINDCLVVRDNDSLSYLYLDLRTEYPDTFKQDLQAFMSKYFVNIAPLYPEFAHEHR